MYRLRKHIIKWALGIFLVLLAYANIWAQEGGKPVPYFEITQCETLDLEIIDMPGDEYTWDIYSEGESNFAITQGDMEAAVYFENGDYRDVSSVTVVNLPVGEYFVKVTAWDEVQCTNNLMVFRMQVIPPPPPIVYGDSVCVDEVAEVRVVFTGTGPWTFDYSYGEGVNYVNVNGAVATDTTYIINITDPLPVGEHTFWVMEVVDGCGIPYEIPVDERPSTGIVIYPKPDKQPIYLKED